MKQELGTDVRLFVSSTFRDMHGERDILTRDVFPLLRARLEPRGLSFFEIDLRWGITSEEAAEGRVLELCLNEIDRCRPFFIALVGDRYGWTDPNAGEILADVAPHLSAYADRSVTELEIRHAVLDPPPTCSACDGLFYFRDLDTPAEAGKERQVAALRADILCRYPGAKSYQSLEDLRNLVTHDLEAVITERFPPRSEADRQEGRTGAYVQRMVSWSLPRPEVMANIRKAVSRSRHVIISGHRGAGKSTLLAQIWHEQRTGASGAHVERTPLLRRITRLFRHEPPVSDMSVIADFSGAHADTGVEAALKRLIEAINRKDGLQTHVAASRWSLPENFARAVAAAASKGPLTLFIDGLDDGPQPLTPDALLPFTRIDIPGVTIVLTLSDNVLADRIAGRTWRLITVPPLVQLERTRMVEAYLERFGRRLDARQLASVSTPLGCANPLFLTTLVEDLRQFGVFEHLDARISFYADTHDPEDLLDRVFERLDTAVADDGDLIGRLFSLLALARGGLSEHEIIRATGLTLRRWLVLRATLASLIVERDGLITPAHASVTHAAQHRYLPSLEAVTTTRRMIISCVEAVGSLARRIDEIPWQLLRSGDFGQLADCLGSASFLLALDKRSPAEARIYISECEAHSSWRAVAVWGSMIDTASPDELLCILRLATDLGYTAFALAVSERLAPRMRDFTHPDIVEFHLQHAELASALGNYGAVIGLLDQASAAAKSLGTATHDLAILVARSHAQSNLHAYDAAMCDAEHSMGQEGAKHPPLRAACLAARARALRGLGRHDDARRDLAEQVQLCRLAGDPASLASALGGLAVLERQQRNAAYAINLHAEEEKLLRLLGARPALTRALANAALSRIDLGQSDQAHQTLDDAERVAQQIGDTANHAIAMAYRALIFLADGHPRAAGQQLEKARKIADEARNMTADDEIAQVETAILNRLRQISGA